MAYGIVHIFPGGTKEQYEASLSVVHPNRNTLPKGQIYHAAGPTDNGWIITALFDNRASWEKFRDEILMPKFNAGIKGGFAKLPESYEFEVQNLKQVTQTHV